MRSLRAAEKVEELTHEMKDTDGTSLDSEKYAGKTLEIHQLQKTTSSSSVAVKTDMSMELDSLFTKTL